MKKYKLLYTDRDKRVFHIISEPGDGTRYDYILINDYGADFKIAPCKSTFKYPQSLNYWEIKDTRKNMDFSNGRVGFDEEFAKKAKEKYHCNPHTLVECMRTVIEIREQS